MVAGLAPLISLWAMGATLAANPQTTVQRQVSRASLHLFQPIVASLLILAAEHASGRASSCRAPSHAVFPADVLRTTPFRGSLCLLSSQTAVDRRARLHSRAALRC